MIIDWKKYLDKIYCLNFTKTKNNIDFLYSELKRVGIYDSGIFYEFINISSPIYKRMYDSIFYKNNPSYRAICSPEYSTLFDSTFCHYFLIKQGYELGYDRIAILEDDVRFTNDLNIIQNFLDNMLENDKYDIYVCQNSLDMYHHTNDVKKFIDEKNYIDNLACIDGRNNIQFVHGGAFNIYTRVGMKAVIDKFETLSFSPIDLYDVFDCNVCFVYPNICTQQHLLYTFNDYEDSMYNFDINDLRDIVKMLKQLQRINVSSLTVDEVYDNVLRLKEKYNWENNPMWDECNSLLEVLKNNNNI